MKNYSIYPYCRQGSGLHRDMIQEYQEKSRRQREATPTCRDAYFCKRPAYSRKFHRFTCPRLAVFRDVAPGSWGEVIAWLIRKNASRATCLLGVRTFAGKRPRPALDAFFVPSGVRGDPCADHCRAVGRA